ncbi:MAG: L,D-transpeptidase [Methylobacillus sp.]|nr:L,D-transpeptidase [Methylobacillus sp.]
MKIEISIAEQKLRLLDDADAVLAEYAISTAKNGAGEQKNSGCTPRGKHIIRAKIGAGEPSGSVFISRRPTGEIWSPRLAAENPERDFILTRILWLSGCEVGVNRLGAVDTMQRYIYIHGTPDIEPMGIACSHGCVRMRNADVLELFERVAVGTMVVIR